MDLIQLKGVRDGVKVVVSSTARMPEMVSELEEKLSQTKELFQIKTEMTVYVEGAALTHSDKVALQKSIFKILGDNVLVVYEQKKTVINPETVFHMGTLRSGQNITSDGHLIIKGDVNPGAEITAAGNVVVLGALKGIVHAGSEGNRDAIVAAMQLNPMQIRIADIITRSPDDMQEAPEPEFAYIKDDRIYIDVLIKK